VSKKSARFRTVQEAVDAIPRGNTAPWEIEIAPGRYTERLAIPRDKPFIRLIGQDVATAVLSFNLSTATTAETRYSAST
jgi:pectinesterase